MVILFGYFVQKNIYWNFLFWTYYKFDGVFPQRITTRQQRGSTTYYNVATTWYNIATMWLQRSKNVTERERNACAVLLLGCGTLSYVVVRYDTLWYAILHGGSEAQRGGPVAWRQWGMIRLWFSQRDDNVYSTWRQRCTTWHPAAICTFFQNVDDQKRGRTARPKRNTTTGVYNTALRLSIVALSFEK